MLPILKEPISILALKTHCQLPVYNKIVSVFKQSETKIFILKLGDPNNSKMGVSSSLENMCRERLRSLSKWRNGGVSSPLSLLTPLYLILTPKNPGSLSRQLERMEYSTEGVLSAISFTASIFSSPEPVPEVPLSRHELAKPGTSGKLCMSVIACKLLACSPLGMT